jgi:hypothetical protein
VILSLHQADVNDDFFRDGDRIVCDSTPAHGGKGAVLRIGLFGLKPWSATTLAGAAMLLGVVTLIASLAPAVKAANVDPTESLRTE